MTDAVTHTIILDGATGTELARRGVDTGLPLWSANALLTAPEVVKQIHLDYLRAGAQVITANTFRTNPRTLARVGLAGQSRALTHLAVHLARRAIADFQMTQADAHPLIAGSIAPVEDCYSPWLVPSDAELEAEHGELAHTLAQAGCDLILVETMNTVREAVIAARAATATGLPVWVSFVLNADNALLSGESLCEAVHAVLAVRPAAVLVNCIPVTQTRAAVLALRTSISDAPVQIGAYANAGHVEESGWTMTGGVPPAEYGRAAVEWQAAGATIIGGCCGTTPEHIAHLARHVKAQHDKRV
ncbi:MAG: homocysteine S-methyltransferase family protein [Anaerolineae bacterium]|nr:homocysteine S-methyltransferase family protein [Thermoflexales bacterium]MDW8407893.1 homocysteine S-methyltransferase family protein [Anaerolineae bacterium]